MVGSQLGEVQVAGARESNAHLPDHRVEFLVRLSHGPFLTVLDDPRQFSEVLEVLDASPSLTRTLS